MPASRNAAKVGTFVALGLGIIAFLFVYFSKGGLSVTPHLRLNLVADSVGGLNPGAKILMSGVPVGNVEKTELTDGGRKVTVYLRISNKHPVPMNARFSLETAGFLGDQYVAISIPKNPGQPLADGASVVAEAPFNIQEAAKQAMSLMAKLDGAADRINAAMERVDKMLLTENALTNLAAVPVRLNAVVADADNGVNELRGYIASNAPAIPITISNLNRVAAVLGSVGSNIDAAVAELRPSLSATATNLATASDSLKETLAGVKEGHGLAGALVKDDALRDKAFEAVSSLATVSSNLARFGLLYKPKPVKTNAPAPLRPPKF
jgi:phospholipid/cholesterol/gamma-HCH transport system substrate-binding protein